MEHEGGKMTRIRCQRLEKFFGIHAEPMTFNPNPRVIDKRFGEAKCQAKEPLRAMQKSCDKKRAW